VDHAGLEDRLRESHLDGFGHPLEAIGAEHEDVLDATSLELGEDGEPELGAFAVLKPETEHVFAPIDADDDVHALVLDLPLVTDLHDEGVDIDDRVHRLEGPIPCPVPDSNPSMRGARPRLASRIPWRDTARRGWDAHELGAVLLERPVGRLRSLRAS